MSLEQLAHLQLVSVTGEDAKTFLQGQLSNDINALDGQWQFSAYCNPKGRAIAAFTIWDHEHGIYMLCEKSLVETVLKRLRMYVMRSKVVFKEVEASITGAFNQESVQGITELQVISENFTQTKERFCTTLSTEIDLLSFGDRQMIVDRSNSIEGQKGQRWIAEDIKDALPRVTAETTEMFIPQMMNMDLVNGISFKKGCYTGQEIIARMHYLGKLKQRGFVCEVLEAKTASLGEKVVDEDGKAAGNLINVAQISDEPNLIFAALRHQPKDEGADKEESAKTLILESGAQIKILASQPYSFD